MMSSNRPSVGPLRALTREVLKPSSSIRVLFFCGYGGPLRTTQPPALSSRGLHSCRRPAPPLCVRVQRHDGPGRPVAADALPLALIVPFVFVEPLIHIDRHRRQLLDFNLAAAALPSVTTMRSRPPPQPPSASEACACCGRRPSTFQHSRLLSFTLCPWANYTDRERTWGPTGSARAPGGGKRASRGVFPVFFFSLALHPPGRFETTVAG
mmetsp:Transcript_11447/g.36348  ORF Transcript_11447/g.36348 Transcript_11447/m.36348 type:complete len:210 (-) Transcript_11447:82-711(-)